MAEIRPRQVLVLLILDMLSICICTCCLFEFGHAVKSGLFVAEIDGGAFDFGHAVYLNLDTLSI